MYIIQPLIDHRIRIQLHRMTVLLPKLILFIITISPPRPPKQPKKQFPATFPRIVAYCLRDLHRSIFLNIPNNPLKTWFAVPPNDHVDVTAHDAIRTQLQSFVLLTAAKAGKENVFVFLADEYVQPVDDGEGDKVEFVLISDFVFAAHGG